MLVGSGRQNGIQVISAVLGEPSETARNDDTVRLLQLRHGPLPAHHRRAARRERRRARADPLPARRRARARGRPQRRADRRPAPRARARDDPADHASRARSAGRSPTGRSSARPTCCRTGARSRPSPLVASGEVPAAGLAQRTKSWFATPIGVLLAFAVVERYGAAGTAAPATARAGPQAGSRGGGGRMIITVTLNTAIDKTLSVPNFRLGRRHRTVEQTTMPGGKGVNVARVLKTLGDAGDRHRHGRRRDRHPHRRPAHAALGAQRLRAHPRGVAHQHRGDRPDERRADRDQRARPEGLRAGGRAVRRQAALPRQGRAHVRVRRLAAARGRHRHLRAADPRAAPARRGDRSSTPTATRCGAPCARSRTSCRRTCSRPRSSSATSSTTTRTASSPCARWSASARARR